MRGDQASLSPRAKRGRSSFSVRTEKELRPLFALDGKLRNCLFALDEADVKPLLRGQPDDARLAELIRENVRAKWEGHEINTSRFIKPLRTMHAIGG
jgi:molybdenum cofactor biosynthesis enzyme MoaA